jgi:hypothetical protein
MEYDEVGIPHVRVRLGGDNITITGNVNLVDNVRINNTEAQMIPVYLVGNVLTVNQGTNPWVTTGNANIIGNISGITTLPAITGNVGVSGNVSITQMPAIAGNVDITRMPGITGNVRVYGNVNVDNFPTNVKITQMPGITGNVGVTGNVGIVGNVNVTQGTNPWTVAGNLTATVVGGTIETVPVDGPSRVSAFGEPYGITITPVIQLDGIYGITDEVIQTYTYGTGASASASPSDALWTVRSGTTPYGYGVLRSKRFLRYRPGQGALARFTAAFTPNVAASSQRVGLANQENNIQIGWNDDGVHGPRFGVLRSTGGKVQIVVLTINTAPTGSQTANVTLNGTSHSISITAGTTQATAVSINNTDGFTGWLTDQVDNTIVFMSTSLGPKNGTYSFSSSGTGTLATGTFVTKQVGIAQTEHWTYQENFNVDTLGANIAGPNPSGMTLRSEYLNVYQINFRWLGVGEIRFAIEDSNTGNMIFFHREHYTNRNALPHTAQPSFKIAYTAYNLAGGTGNVKVTGASMMGAIEGDIRQNELNRSTSVNKTTLAQNTMHHLLTIRNPYVTNGAAGALNGNYILNAKEIILKDISVGTQNTDPALLYIFYEPTSFSGIHSYYSQPKDNGMISTVDGTLDPAVDTAICQFVTAINGESQYKLSDFRIAIPPGSWVSFAIKSTNGISRATMALVFSED